MDLPHRHILDAIARIAQYTEGLTDQQFANDERTVDAVIRNFLVIGDTSRRIPENVRRENGDLPWRLMEGMRHVLVHDYDSVKVDTIWKTVVEDLPPLVDPLRRRTGSFVDSQGPPPPGRTLPVVDHRGHNNQILLAQAIHLRRQVMNQSSRNSPFALTTPL